MRVSRGNTACGTESGSECSQRLCHGAGNEGASVGSAWWSRTSGYLAVRGDVIAKPGEYRKCSKLREGGI